MAAVRPSSLSIHRFLLGLALLLAVLPILHAAHADTIEELVAQVSELRLRQHIAALEYPRAAAPDLARAAGYITERLEAFGYEVIHQPLYSSENVIARLEGTARPESVLVIGAHFDTVAGSPGADDNASGVAALLEIARVLAGKNMPYTIEFVAFTYEELWMVGSFYYVQQALAHGMNIFGMIDFDMIGYTCDAPGCQAPFWDIGGCFQVDPDGVNVGTFVATLVNDASVPLLDACTLVAGTYVPTLEVVTMQVAGNGDCFSFTRRSDHVPFWDAGIPAIEFQNTYGSRNPYYHTGNDRLATLDMTFCLRITQTALAVAVLPAAAGIPTDVAGSTLAYLHGAFPNPLSSHTRIRFELAEAGPIALRVYDTAGRYLRTLASGPWQKGTHELTWDGCDDQSRPLAGGVYFIRLEADTRAESRTVVVLE